MVVLSIISRDYYHNLPRLPAFPAFPPSPPSPSLPPPSPPSPHPPHDGCTPSDPRFLCECCDCDSPVDRNLRRLARYLLHPPLLGGVSGEETSSPAINSSTNR